MEYQNVDEAVRRQACERVKQLAELIKKIRKKYYLCFNKISDPDKAKYEELKAKMQVIAEENGLKKLSVELIHNIDIQYSGKRPANMVGDNNKPTNKMLDEVYQMYLAAVQLLTEIIIKFKHSTDAKKDTIYMKRAIAIQSYIKELLEFLEQYCSKIKLKRDKWNELFRKFEEQTREYLRNTFEICYNSVKVEPLKLNEANEIIATCIAKEKDRDRSMFAEERV